MANVMDRLRYRIVMPGNGRFRQALRTLARAKGFVVTVVVLIAIGVGANSAAIRFAARLFWDWPTGIAHPEDVKRLYVLTRWTVGNIPIIRPEMKYAWYHLISESDDFGWVAAAYTSPDSFEIEDASGPRMALGSYTTSSYWALLGLQAERGRLFDSTEDRMGDPTSVVVVSHAAAMSWFGETDSVVGRVLRINGHPFTVVGITRQGFFGTDLTQAAFWVPLASFRGAAVGDVPWYESWKAPSTLRVLIRGGRRASDGPQAALTTLIRQRELAYLPLDPDTTATILTGSLREALGPSLTVRPEVLISSRLMLVSMGLLLVVCLNIGTLALVRASRQSRDKAVRFALGASRGRLVSDVVLENTIIGAIGSAVAVPAALACEQLLRATVSNASGWRPLSMGWVLPATALAGGLVAVLALCLPQLIREFHLFGSNAFDVSGTRETRAPGVWELGAVVFQFAVAVALVGGAGLFVQNVINLRAIDVGYDVDDLVIGSATFAAPSGSVTAGLQSSNSDRLSAALAEINANPRAIVDAQGSALASAAPLHSYTIANLYHEDGSPIPNVANLSPAIFAVSPEYFGVAGLRVARGRALVPDDKHGPPVVVINETAARTYWNGVNPIGQCLVLMAPQQPCSSVIGVVHDAHLTGLVEQPRAAVFVLFGQTVLTHAKYIVVRTTPDARQGVSRQLEQLLRRELGPDAIPQVTTMASFIAPALQPWDLGALLFSLFGLFAVLTAAVGAYGVMSSTVEARRRELAVRNALGATWTRIGVWLVVTRGGVLLVGLALGVAFALALAGTLRSHLVGIGYLGWGSLISAQLIVGAVGTLAIVVPIAGAARTNTVELLRPE